MRFAGMSPLTILQKRQSDDGELLGVAFVMVESTSDAAPVSRGYRPPQTPLCSQLTDGYPSRTRQMGAAWGHRASSPQAFGTPVESSSADQRRCHESPPAHTHRQHVRSTG